MAKVLLGVTGSVAAIRTPGLYGALLNEGHDVRVVATDASLYFFDPTELAGRGSDRVVIVDADEWPGRPVGKRYHRDDAVLHIEMRRWAELLAVAPLDANTLAKFASGLADNCLTCVWRCWDLMRPVLLAPAMNTLMWEHPLTRQHLAQLAGLFGVAVPPDVDADNVVDCINTARTPLRLVGPITKRLACGDVGVGAMSEVADIVAAVGQCLSA